MELFGGFAKQAGMSVQDYVARIRFQAKQAQGMSTEEAKRSIDLEDREAAVSAKEAEEAQRQNGANQAAQARAAADARRNADIAEFQRLFPDAAKDPKAIPQEVWASVRSGMSLVSAYSKYAVDQANAARQAAEQKAAAPGSPPPPSNSGWTPPARSSAAVTAAAPCATPLPAAGSCGTSAPWKVTARP